MGIVKDWILQFLLQSIYCEQIDSGSFGELKIIDSDGQWIKKEQLIDLKEEFSKKSINGKQKVYIINNADKLNVASSNSLLKFLLTVYIIISFIIKPPFLFFIFRTLVRFYVYYYTNIFLFCQYFFYKKYKKMFGILFNKKRRVFKLF